MRKFNIIITDNTTGKTVYAKSTDAIIAAVCEDDSVGSMVHTDCSTVDLVHTIAAARAAVDTALECEPREIHRAVGRVYRAMKRQQRGRAKK